MAKLDVLILPDVAVITDEQLKQLQKFIEAGKSIVVTGAAGMLDNTSILTLSGHIYKVRSCGEMGLGRGYL